MKKTITSILALVAMFFATSAMAQTTLKGSVDQYPTSDYSTSSLSFSLSEIATALETDTSTLVAALDAWSADPDVVESMFYDAPNDTTYSNNYTQGSAGGFWMDANSVPMSWGSGCAWFNQLGWSSTSDVFNILVGQYPGGMTAGTSVSTTFVLVFNGKKVNFDVTLNVKATPVLDKDPVGWLSKLTILDTKEIQVTQYPRSNWASDAISFDVSGMAAQLGIDPTVLSANMSKVLFAKTYNSTNEIINDSLTNTFTATPNPGFWYIKTYNEETASEGDEAVQGAYGSEDLFWISSIAYTKTDTSEIVTAAVGQYPEGMQEETTRYGYFYIIYGNSAIAFKVNLTIAKEPAKPYKEMKKVGEENHDYILENDFKDYAIETLTINVDSIAELLGASTSDVALQFLKDADNFSSASTANNGGCWLDAEGYVCSWGTNARCYFEPTSNGAFTSMIFGTYSPGWDADILTDSTTYKGTAYLVANNKYYQINGSFWRKGVTPTVYTVETCDLVATQSYEYQIIPNENYQDYTKQDTTIDLNLAFIQEKLGSTPSFYGENIDAGGNVTYSKVYSCAPNPGFWMSPDPSGTEHRSSTSAWGSTNTYGICYASGILQFFQYPGSSSVAVGNYYTDNFYLVNLTDGKKIKYTITVKYVDQLIPMETVGTENLSLPARSEDDTENGATTTYDLSTVYSALGCSAEEFAEGGQWLAQNGDGQYTNIGYDPQEGFFFDATGKTVNDGSEVIHAGFTEDGNIFSWIIDDVNLTKTYSATIYAQYNSKRYIFNLTVYDIPVGIGSIDNTTTQSTKIYDLSGRLVKNATKGLYIKQGKKYLVK